MLIKKLKAVLIGTKLCAFSGHDRWVGVSSSHTFVGWGGGDTRAQNAVVIKTTSKLSLQGKEDLLQLAIADMAYLKKKHTTPYAVRFIHG